MKPTAKRQTRPKPARKSARIVIVDDHPLIREKLADIIEGEAGMRVCGEAESRADGLRIIADTKPDLAIVDLSLKDSYGLELIKDLKVMHPEVKILVVSLYDESLYAERSLHAGARGYISKQDATRNILGAIEHVLAGEIYVSALASSHIISNSIGQKGKSNLPLDTLSDRELQVFVGIGEGKLNAEIAKELHIATSTVETYRARIRVKLKVKTAAELRRLAILWRRTSG